MADETFLVPLATTVAWGTDRDDWFERCLDDASISEGRFEWLNEHFEVTGYTVKHCGAVLCFFGMVPKDAAVLMEIWGIPNFYNDGRKEDMSRAYQIKLWKPQG